jgi:hypothetical protein
MGIVLCCNDQIIIGVVLIGAPIVDFIVDYFLDNIFSN